MANWEFAAAQLAAANGQGQAFRYPAPSADRSRDAPGSQPGQPHA